MYIDTGTRWLIIITHLISFLLGITAVIIGKQELAGIVNHNNSGSTRACSTFTRTYIPCTQLHVEYKLVTSYYTARLGFNSIAKPNNFY